MKKSTFVNLMVGTIGGLLFALGMCMCLLPEWNAFRPGIAVTSAGALILIVLALVRWMMAGRPVVKVNWNAVGKIAYCTAAALTLGTGMSMIMAFEGLMIPGMIVGIVGIILALGLIPLFKGLK